MKPQRLVQLRDERGDRCVAAARGAGPAFRLEGVDSVLTLAREALTRHCTLRERVDSLLTAQELDLETAGREGRLLPPIDHPDPAHLLLTGTGLTHLGSAESRDAMHRVPEGELTDSMRMFREGLEGGRPAAGAIGAQPEWFFKGNGHHLVGTGTTLVAPDFALDGGEEPELAGIYLVDAEAQPRRLGFCLANEFSDHLTERHNYLWLAHSKLRMAALGPELVDALPADVRGLSRLLRDGRVLWEKPFLTGAANMAHSLANLEHHHFKYVLFRQPGDVHVHFFGTATLSFADGVQTRDGDQFEISATPFRLALRNRLAFAGTQPALRVVRPL